MSTTNSRQDVKKTRSEDYEAFMTCEASSQCPGKERNMKIINAGKISGVAVIIRSGRPIRERQRLFVTLGFSDTH
jgi:hypothetical protein